jgi:hypothetical protein
VALGQAERLPGQPSVASPLTYLYRQTVRARGTMILSNLFLARMSRGAALGQSVSLRQLTSIGEKRRELSEFFVQRRDQLPCIAVVGRAVRTAVSKLDLLSLTGQI